MKKFLLISCVATALAGLSGFAADTPGAGNRTIKDYPIHDIGTLYLDVPNGWQSSFKKTIQVSTYVEELTFQTRGTNDCMIMVQVIHMLDTGKVRDFDTHASCLDAVKSELKTSVEQSPEVHDFKGASTTGSYLRLTDKTVPVTNPKPGEYKYLTLGYAKLSPAIVAFRVVSNHAGPEDTQSAVELIQSAKLIKAP